MSFDAHLCAANGIVAHGMQNMSDKSICMVWMSVKTRAIKQPYAEKRFTVMNEAIGMISRTAFRAKRKGNLKECDCYEPRDKSEYDTCPHDCLYCYAVQSRPLLWTVSASTTRSRSFCSRRQWVRSNNHRRQSG